MSEKSSREFAGRWEDLAAGARPNDRERFTRWQDRHADQLARPLGCHWNREPLELARNSGLKVVRARRTFFGIFIELKPNQRGCNPRHLELFIGAVAI